MEILNIFADFKTWIGGIGVVGFISGVWILVKKNGWALLIDKYAKKGTVIFTKLSGVFDKLADLTQEIDDSIKDNGNLVENNIKEVIAAGKVVKAELKDVIVIIKPKKS